MTNLAAAPATPTPEPPITLPPAELGPATLKQQRYIPLALIHPSPFNPRKDFDAAGLVELAESIRVKGLLKNLGVRPHPTIAGEWELMGGERRWRALKLLGADGAVCKIMEATDAESIALQLIENLQSEAVDPMAEAQAFADLQKLDPEKYSPLNIAAEIGKTKRFVLQRISLVNNLSTELQEAMKSGQGLKIETARTLAAVPQSLQKVVLEKHRWHLNTLSADDVRETIADHAVPMTAAAFDVALYTGEYVEDGKRRLFGDVAMFNKLQTVVAKAKVEALKAEWPDAKLVKESALGNWEWADTGRQVRWAKDHKPGGKLPKKATAIVYIDTDHKIRTCEGVKPYVQPSYSHSSTPSYTETAERKVVREAFNAQLVQAFAKDTAVALRFMLLDLFTGDAGMNVSAAVVKRALPTIDLPGRWMNDGQKAKVWPKFAALSDAAVMTALRELARDQLDEDTSGWGYYAKDCPPLLLALGASLGVKPQAEKPIATPEPKKVGAHEGQPAKKKATPKKAAPKAKAPAKAKAKAKGKKKQ